MVTDALQMCEASPREHLRAPRRDKTEERKSLQGSHVSFSFSFSSSPCLGPCHKRRAGGCCTQLGSLSALKHAVLGLYLLVFLILVGIFILAGKSTLFCSGLEGCGRSCVGHERERN